MCTKLEIYACSGKENEYYLEDNLRCKITSSITLNNATLFWHYKNVRQNSTTPLFMAETQSRSMRDKTEHARVISTQTKI